MRTIITASLDYINIELWKTAVREFMTELFKKAAVKFLNTAIPLVPVWTGHSASAFKNLGDAVGRSISIGTGGAKVRTDKRGGKRVRILRNEYYYPPGGGRIQKTTQSGRQFATQPSAILNTTGVKLASGRVAFYFKFEIDITYFNLLDRDRWHSFEIGTQMFEDFVKQHINEVPTPGKFLTRKKVT